MGVPREKTDIGWYIYPRGLFEILIRMQQMTGSIPIEIAENGCAYNTHPSPMAASVRTLASLT